MKWLWGYLLRVLYVLVDCSYEAYATERRGELRARPMEQVKP